MKNTLIKNKVFGNREKLSMKERKKGDWNTNGEGKKTLKES